jgi:hypothetical protein
MTDWQTEDLEVQVDAQGLVKPPVPLLVVTIVITFTSVAWIAFSSGVGYLVAVLASIMGGVTALKDQKRRGHPSYVTLQWFHPSLRVARYLILAVTLVHVALLAIAAAEGDGILF